MSAPASSEVRSLLVWNVVGGFCAVCGSAWCVLGVGWSGVLVIWEFLLGVGGVRWSGREWGWGCGKRGDRGVCVCLGFFWGCGGVFVWSSRQQREFGRRVVGCGVARAMAHVRGGVFCGDTLHVVGAGGCGPVRCSVTGVSCVVAACICLECGLVLIAGDNASLSCGFGLVGGVGGWSVVTF